jgi:hypothetical protein
MRRALINLRLNRLQFGGALAGFCVVEVRLSLRHASPSLVTTGFLVAILKFEQRSTFPDLSASHHRQGLKCTAHRRCDIDKLSFHVSLHNAIVRPMTGSQDNTDRDQDQRNQSTAMDEARFLHDVQRPFSVRTPCKEQKEMLDCLGGHFDPGRFCFREGGTPSRQGYTAS